MSNPRIHALPLHLANQIAAGEVIERPASVVKELIENSLDAGATQIDIDIEGAGQKLIRVRDNGNGIHPDDLSLALSRHATSKLHSSEQLSHISSLGFRGEALPSISSISQLTLTSRQHDSECAWQLKQDASQASPASHPLGTSIEVRDLFFNLPARRHFLRSNKTELHHILTTLQRLALSQFHVAFHCTLSDTQQLKLPIALTEQQKQQRIAKICGKSFIEHSVYLQQDYDDIQLSGWVVNAEAHRPHTDAQHFFINGRVIRDRVINHAIRQAYGESIPVGRHPAYVLYLTLPLDRVDINVHPTKHEVRFRDARLIHGLITSALHEALEKFSPISNFEVQPEKKSEHKISEQQVKYAKTGKIDPSYQAKTHSFGKAINILHNRYVISQSESQGLLLLDLQQLNTQLRQQQLEHAIESDTLKTRPILVPIKLDLDSSQFALAQQHESNLKQLGIELHFLSTGQSNHIIIKSIPSLLAHVDVKSLLHALIDSLADDSSKPNSSAISGLKTVLSYYLPTLPITELTDAQQIIEQCNSLPTAADWCKQLDQQTLDSLFLTKN